MFLARPHTLVCTLILVLPMWLAAAIDLSEADVFFRPGDDPSWSTSELNANEWTQVSLPHHWHRSATGTNASWYRITVSGEELATLKAPVALDLGIIGYVAEVFVNGELIGENGDFKTHLGATEFKPDVFPLPEKYLEAESLDIAVRTSSIWGPGGLLKGPWLIGELAPRYERAEQFGRWRWLVIVALETVILFWCVLFAMLLA